MNATLIVVLAVGAVVLFLAYRRWSNRQAARIVLRLPTGMLFDLARADGPVNEAERQFIVAYATVLHRRLLQAGNTGISAEFVHQALAGAESGLSEREEEDFIRFLGRTPRNAKDFFELCCQLATIDGPMTWNERQKIEGAATFSMLDVYRTASVLETLCPFSKREKQSE